MFSFVGLNFIDSSIKMGIEGEILIFENGKFFRADMQGRKYRLKPVY